MDDTVKHKLCVGTHNAKCMYVDGLVPEAKRRYFEKIVDVDGVDPYEIPKRSWSVNPDDLPEVGYINIVNYFVYGKSSYTTDDFKAYKSLKSYKTFVAGWVRDVASYRPDGCQNVVVSAKVLHSQKLNEKPLTPWVITSSDGIILSAHCTCMAGVGETCSHVGALLFALDAFCTAREKTTCTGTKAYWKVPLGVRGVTPKPAYQIDFSSAKARKQKVDAFIADEQAEGIQPSIQKKLLGVAEPSEEELAGLFQQLNTNNTKPNVLRVLPAHCQQFKVDDHPTSLRALHQKQCEGKSLPELQEFCKDIDINVSPQASQKLEEDTRSQADSHLWFSARAGRITASKLHAVCHTNTDHPSISLVRQICYPEQHKFSSIYTDWGNQKEDAARESYLLRKKAEHDNLTFRPSGVHVPPEFPFMGASPDGIVSCNCHGTGCIEIKCPYIYRNSSLDEAFSDKSFCLQRDVGDKSTLSLKPGHKYFVQVQAQLFLSHSLYCDFIVWTTVDMAVVRVFPDQVFWDECVDKARKLFRLAILPELVGNWTVHEQAQSSLKTSQTPVDRPRSSDQFCLCGEGEHGRMIACDNSDCKIEWFHFSCVGLRAKPRGAWYCPGCTPKPKSKKNKC